MLSVKKVSSSPALKKKKKLNYVILMCTLWVLVKSIRNSDILRCDWPIEEMEKIVHIPVRYA